MVARADQLARVHDALDAFWAKLGEHRLAAPGAEFTMRFAAAVAEVAANIVEHAYPNRGPNDMVELLLSAYPDRVEALFTDQGVLFKEPTATRPSQGLAEGGYGLALAREATDSVTYQRTSNGVNQWRIMKKFTNEELETANSS